MSVTAKITDIARKLTGVRSAIDELHGAEQALREAYEAERAERVRLIATRPSRVEAIAAIGAEVDALAERWRLANGEQILASAGGVARNARGEITGLAGANVAGVLTGPVSFDALCGIVGDLVKAGLARAVESAPDYDESGPALVDRLDLIHAAEEKIASLEAAHSRLVDDAARADVVITHLPDVAMRRRAESLRAEEAERARRAAAGMARSR